MTVEKRGDIGERTPDLRPPGEKAASDRPSAGELDAQDLIGRAVAAIALDHVIPIRIAAAQDRVRGPRG